MSDIIEHYKGTVVSVIGIMGTFVMLASSCTAYTGIIENVLNMVFYK